MAPCNYPSLYPVPNRRRNHRTLKKLDPASNRFYLTLSLYHRINAMHLKCSHIGYHYPGAEQPLFEDLEFQLREPGFNALFGPSGVGKTSLAGIISGAVSGYTGTVDSQGMDRRLYTYNLERLPGWSSVGSHIKKVTPTAVKVLRESLIDEFGIRDCMNSRFSQLSLGQKNRVNLIRYLLQDFDLLIMDETLANVDERTREHILLIIKELFPERFFLYISHNVVEVSRFCREITILRGIHKSPQATTLKGLDQRRATDPGSEKRQLESVMLEIMNAA